ncbi:hypothetical protein AC1031_016762 [Aphanomyces cochlioides]|nr:hypothetical protein AC1031_016762 [Aphanomyces cochlioides]
MSGKGKGKAKAQHKGKGKAKVPAQDKGKRKAKVPLTVDRLLDMTAVAIRQKHSRDTAKQLDATNEQLLQVMRKQVELLEEELLRRKQETDPYYLALVLARAEILEFEEQNRELQSMLENREKLKGWLAAWVDTYMVHKGSPNYMEVTLLQDDYGRRRGGVYMINRTHMMSQNFYPYKPHGYQVEDTIDIKIHCGEDEHGECVKAYECHLQFSIEGNYENVAKTWRFDYTDCFLCWRLKRWTTTFSTSYMSTHKPKLNELLSLESSLAIQVKTVLRSRILVLPSMNVIRLSRARLEQMDFNGL